MIAHQLSGNDFWNIVAQTGRDVFGASVGFVAVVAGDDHLFGRHAIA